MGRKGLTALSGMDTEEISLVKRGANKKKRFPIFKTEDDMDINEILKSVLETETDGENDFEEKVLKAMKLSEKGQNAAKAAYRLLMGFKDELPAGVVEKLAEAAGVKKMKPGDDEEYKYPEPTKKEEVEKWMKGLPEELKKALAPVDGDEGKEGDTKVDKNLEAIMKTHKDEIDALKKEGDKVLKALEEERDTREKEKWVAKAKEELSHYPGKNAQELGEQLHNLSKADPELAKQQFEAMKTTSESLQKSELLREIGGRVEPSDTGSTWAKVEKMAEDYVKKSEDLEMTKEKAVRKVLKRRPDLYEGYLKENPKQCAN
jgi:hypothetical protein